MPCLQLEELFRQRVDRTLRLVNHIEAVSRTELNEQRELCHELRRDGEKTRPSCRNHSYDSAMDDVFLDRAFPNFRWSPLRYLCHALEDIAFSSVGITMRDPMSCRSM